MKADLASQEGGEESQNAQNEEIERQHVLPCPDSVLVPLIAKIYVQICLDFLKVVHCTKVHRAVSVQSHTISEP